MTGFLIAAWAGLGGAAGAALAAGLSWPVRAAVGMCSTLVFAALAWRFDAHPVLVAFSCFTAVGVVLAATDLTQRRLPNCLILPSYPALVIALGLAAASMRDYQSLLRAVLVSVAAVGLHLVLYLGLPGQLGGGDVKLAGLCGLTVGWVSWAAAGTALLLSYVSAAAALLVLNALACRRGRHRRGDLPLGPFLICSTLAIVLTGSA
ncbi:prepilin peptidase [Crossiella sp. SN42]|uniref:prepilin peptidase n=1 Tax=Crossiella sp. SN42 TaxID=2944808 RepID=UPI00207D40EE|nr:prepilin peptidase [Crossiella sp. SN42]MCO1575871.1 prepilin peptidase [Crossiella sp. SN42]